MVQRSGASLLRITPVTYTTEELASFEDMIEAGTLPPDYLDNYFDQLNAAVFGEDAPKDRHGRRKEQGLGSPINQTRQSIEAYKRWHKDDPDYEDGLKKLEAQFAECQARRKAEAEATRKTSKRRFHHDQPG